MTTLAQNSDSPLAGLAPVRPQRRSVKRQCLMWLLLIVLSGCIGGYWYITDSNRLRGLAQTYLSKLLGEKVTVRRAYFSIFEGLRLEQVNVYLSESGEDEDARIFAARVLQVRPSPKTFLTGKLESTQITALDPTIFLCEDVDRGSWNFDRLLKGKVKTPKPDQRDKQDRGMSLPELRLRGGVIELSRIVRGRRISTGKVFVDGELTPMELISASSAGKFAFDLESRMPGDPVGPKLRGFIDADQGIEARLEDLEFDSTLLSVLPAQVQEVCREHQLAGRVRVPVFRYMPGKKDQPATFDVELELIGVRLKVLPEELLGDEYAQQMLWRPGYRLATSRMFQMLDETQAVAQVARPEGIEVKDVSGRFHFTPEKIELLALRGKIEGNNVLINGHFDGYGGDAAGELHIAAYNLFIPTSPRYLTSLPHEVRQEIEKYRPSGLGHLVLDIERKKPSGSRISMRRSGYHAPVEVSGRLDIVDGGLRFIEFPYPLAHAHGPVEFGRLKRDLSDGFAHAGDQFVHLEHVHGHGADGTANQKTDVVVDGWVAPLDRTSHVLITVKANDVWLDDVLRSSLPKDAREAIAMFDAERPDKTVIPAQMHGNFVAVATRPRGYRKRLTVQTSLDLLYAKGAFREFTYPLDNVTGHLEIGFNETKLSKVVARMGETELHIDGNVTYGNGQPIDPQIRVNAQRVPIDDRLLDAIEGEEAQWLRKIGMGGLLDIEGKVELKQDLEVDPSNPERVVPSQEIDFRLNIGLSGGTMWPVDGKPAITDMTASLTLFKDRMDLHYAAGKRGDADLSGHGKIAWPRDNPSFSLTVDATNLAMDRVLHEMAPPRIREGWDRLRPEGTVDMSVTYSGGIEENDSSGQSESSLTAWLRPRELAINPAPFAWKMEKLGGEVTVDKEGVHLKKLVAHHGDATVMLSGTVAADAAHTLDLTLNAGNLKVDQEFRAALPDAVRDLLKSTSFGDCTISLENVKVGFPKLVKGEEKLVPATRPVQFNVKGMQVAMIGEGASANPSRRARTYDQSFEFSGRLHLNDAAMEVGLPLSELSGFADISGAIYRGELLSIGGKIEAPTLKIAQRPAHGLRINFLKKPDSDIYQFYDMGVGLAGGKASGQVDFSLPDSGPSRYAMEFSLQEVDLKKLLADPEGKFRGRMSASVNLGGEWSNTASRVGGGVVQVSGQDLMDLPAVTGLLQITNIAMPIKSPFQEAGASYSVMGNKMVLENIELRSKNMLMQGAGLIDYGSKRVDLRFTTSNPDWPRLAPFESLKNELFQIQVKGTLSEPKVRTRTLPIFTTSVDDVTRSGKGQGGR